MNICRDCKWWGEQSESNYGDFVAVSINRACTNPKVNGDDPRQTHLPNHSFRLWRDHVVKGDGHVKDMESEHNHTYPLDMAFPDAADDHNIGFYTGPEFGCVQWEPK